MLKSNGERLWAALMELAQIGACQLSFFRTPRQYSQAAPNGPFSGGSHPADCPS